MPQGVLAALVDGIPHLIDEHASENVTMVSDSLPWTLTQTLLPEASIGALKRAMGY